MLNNFSRVATESSIKFRDIFSEIATISKMSLYARLIFRARHKNCFSVVRAWKWRVLGMRVGASKLPRLSCTWPHQVEIGNDCTIELGTAFKFDGIWRPGPCIRIAHRVFIGRNCEFNIRVGIDVGDDTLIAAGCQFVDHDHGTKLGALMRIQQGSELPITIGRDVWIGANVVVLKGVIIGDGAIVGAGAVVTKSIGENEIWGGVPAKRIGIRA
jgi:acetyltransferase-like isoleucine patch superfamily enzyme